MHERNLQGDLRNVHVIIPALDEEAGIGRVVASLTAAGFAHIIVVDNGSRDGTAAAAQAHGACVVHQPEKGYGAACLAGIAVLATVAAGDDVVAFIDGDGSDDPHDLHRLVLALKDDRADLVIGSRTLGQRERGSQPMHARLGNRLACGLLALRTGKRFTDLGPLRALRYSTLMTLNMTDRNYGWTVEMQLKAARRFRVLEMPVSYRARVGRSKISGTLAGSVRAGSKILWTIATHDG